MLVKKIRGKEPKWGKGCKIAENATIVGDVSMGDDCTVWYGAVIRGDVNSIRIGNRVNIQDGVVLHATLNKYSLEIGNNVSIGHRAIVHGCRILDNVLVGMGSIVMDDCLVKSNVIVAAGAVVTEHSVLEEGGIYAGVPARRVKELSKEQISRIDEIARHYVDYGKWATEGDVDN